MICICDSFLLCLLVLWLTGRGGGSDPFSEGSKLQRAERAKASEASHSERMRAVVYLQLGTRQTKKAQTTLTKKLHISNL